MFIGLNVNDYFKVYRNNNEEGVRHLETDITYWETEEKEKFDFINSLLTIKEHMEKELEEQGEKIQEIIAVSEKIEEEKEEEKEE